jgi:hypothetical protein
VTIEIFRMMEVLILFLDVERSITCASSCDNFMLKVPSLFAHQQGIWQVLRKGF